MQISELQEWVKKEFGPRIEGMAPEHQLAFLLEQAGQLAQGVIHTNAGAVELELAHVLLALVGVANKHRIDFAKAVEVHLTSRSADEILRHINL